MPSADFSRRDFLKTAALASAPFLLRWDLGAAPAGPREPLRFGLCADPHQDIMHDAEARLRVFIDAMKKSRPDFILQLGDFCQPREKNRNFLKIWEEFPGPRYHTLGNHDCDGGFTRAQLMKFWGMEKLYYSFDQGGWHFVVLDGNEKNTEKKVPGYARHIGREQLAWLTADLKATKLPVVLFSHQSLESDEDGVDNREEVRAVLEKANADAGWKKVGICLSGHHHIDFQREIAGITYVQINSMSYVWLGDKYKRVRYSAEIDKAHPYIKYTAPYKDPLYATVTLDPAGLVTIAGTSTEFVGPSPEALGAKGVMNTDTDPARRTPKISDRKIKVGKPV